MSKVRPVSLFILHSHRPPQLSTENTMKFQLASLYVLSFNVNIVDSLKQPKCLPSDFKQTLQKSTFLNPRVLHQKCWKHPNYQAGLGLEFQCRFQSLRISPCSSKCPASHFSISVCLSYSLHLSNIYVHFILRKKLLSQGKLLKIKA